MLLHTKKRRDFVAKGEMIGDLREMSNQTGPTSGLMKRVALRVATNRSTSGSEKHLN
jgi:hypothetical protein